jgi:menaquinol-cytochrome c reductase iron-sulfur subunit
MSEPMTRRGLLLKLGIALNALAGLVLAVPIVGYLLSPARRRRMRAALQWVALGELSAFPEGQTRMATFRNPSSRPWDGPTADIPCWVRRRQGSDFQVFAVNCAHLGCPVRWFPQSHLFLCPCHGGAYYADGSRAAGPPPRGLFQYECRVENDRLWIKAGMMPTLGTLLASAGPPGGGPPCA